MDSESSSRRSAWRKIYALPAEHGSWIWWIGPFVLGAAAARTASIDLLLLAVAVLLAFLIRQPVSLLVKIFSGRRPRADLPPVLTWIGIYAVLLAAAGLALIARGHGRLFLLLLPGLPVFGWHLWLVSRRQERGQRGIEIVGSGVLALAAPGAYWVCGGGSPSLPWILWLLAWLQSAASIVLVYLRLEQRNWEATSLRFRLQAGGRSIAYYLANVLVASGLGAAGVVPWGVPAAFGLLLLDALAGVMQPAIGARPIAIGMRQLLASSAFYLLASIAFLV